MNRALILPALIAAGLHGLLLGFKSSQPVLPATDQTGIEDEDAVTKILITEPPEPPEIQNFEPTDLSPPVPLIPQGAEIPVFTPTTEFTVIRPPSPKVDGPATTLIDPNWRPPSDSSRSGPPVYVVADLQNVPRALLRTSPARPPGTSEESGTVTVDFVVGKDGNVMQTRVVDSTDSRFEETCLRAVKRWRFEPGMRKNLPVAFRMQQTFVFTTHE